MSDDLSKLVKRLVWVTYGTSVITLPTDTQPEYCAAPSVADTHPGEWRMRGPWIGFKYFPTLEAAKAAAQADYAARIIAALDPEALKEAVSHLRKVHDDSFKQAAGHGLMTADGRSFSCFQINRYQEVAGECERVIAKQGEQP